MNSIPEIILDTNMYKFNLTVWISILTVCLTTMATLIKIFGRKFKPEELPGNNFHCKQRAKDTARLQKSTEDIKNEIKDVKNKLNNLDTKVAVLTEKSESSRKSLEEMKILSRDLTLRLDDLLKQLIDYANS